MRIVIDLQAAQSTGSRNRGIGRYSLSLAKAMARNRGEHEIHIALSGLFPETIEPIRADFEGVLKQEHIHVWYAVPPVCHLGRENNWRRQSAEKVREAFLVSLRPDIVHVSSVFEGYADDAVGSVGTYSGIPTAVTLYDLIPLIHPVPYLEDPDFEAWYLEKLEHLRRADLWLAISESSRQEGLRHLGLAYERTVTISTAADTHFRPIDLPVSLENEIRQQYGLTRPFVMYTGGIDHRKNIEGLIRAFALLPLEIRRTQQLAIVCAARSEDKRRLHKLAESAGLSSEDVVLTGFVPDDHLVALYNLCKLFVFPSWHEGFGLPALEAMQCGAPVIGSNVSSIPEVVGWDGALFDPLSDEAISRKMEQALSDESFRTELIKRGVVQAKAFSWDEIAKRTIAAYERFHLERAREANTFDSLGKRPKLAYVSPLPPARSGIADYSAELLPELARHYDIELIVSQPEGISMQSSGAGWPVRSPEWLLGHAADYDRVLYHFGNSAFHAHMFDLLEAVPGVVVLHDFFLSGIVQYMNVMGVKPGFFIEELYAAHGYPALKDFFQANDVAEVIWQYPCNLSVLQNSLSIIAHSEYSRRLISKWFNNCEPKDWAVIPLMRQLAVQVDRYAARQALGLPRDAFIVCSFGILGPTKLNHRLLDAWLSSSLGRAKNCYLVFVGENFVGDYGLRLSEKIRLSTMQDQIRITGWADVEAFRNYLSAADVGVQLRTLSRGETSAAVLDCMNYGLATIVNANGSMADLPDHGVWKLPDVFTDEQLVEALETLKEDLERREGLGRVARQIISESHDPGRCADQYFQTIERGYQEPLHDVRALAEAVGNVDSAAPSEDDLLAMAESIAKSIPLRPRNRQLLVDISEFVERDRRSGIQRVVRNVLREWVTNPVHGLRVEPVYAKEDATGYRYAREFMMKFLGRTESVFEDDPIEFAPGDVFLGLDLQPSIVCAQQAVLQEMRSHGVCVKFVVYDLLPILCAETFVDGAAQSHAAWLSVVAQSDGAICISQSVADELREWLRNIPVKRDRGFSIDWFHLGADVGNSTPSLGVPKNAVSILEVLASKPTFLSVGTLEPRKNLVQVLAAFSQLWQFGQEINLVVVGKPGWLMDDLVKKLRNHPQLGKRLFWLDEVSDEYLEKIYSASTCLIAASIGEGFGLPLIEAAQHKLAIIARDIPVFHEVAGTYAFYFSGLNPEDLASAVQEWLQHYASGHHPKSDAMPWLTWKKSAEILMERIIPIDARIQAELKN